jgi:hypothetical protein
MDTDHWTRVMARLAAEADQLRRTHALLRGHVIGDGWRGPARREAEAALADTLDAIALSIAATDDAWSEARAAFRVALSQSAMTG